jgi:hypothetical protein
VHGLPHVFITALSCSPHFVPFTIQQKGNPSHRLSVINLRNRRPFEHSESLEMQEVGPARRMRGRLAAPRPACDW